MTSRQSPPIIRPILLGTGNTDKEQSLRWLLEDLPLSPTTPAGLHFEGSPEETGDTHEAIAQTKAIYWSQATSMLSIASDGGLLLPALGSNWESRYTHRFAGPEASNDQRLERLLGLMQPFSGDEREASWVEAVAIADQGRLLASWQVKGASGVIVDRFSSIPQHSGFWAFSLWYFPQYGKTYNQLSLNERKRLGDHWVQLQKLVQTFFRGYLEPVTS